MKYKEDDILYYVYPFPILETGIDKVQIEMAVCEHDGLYYIDKVGAYLKEEDLFETFEEAKNESFKRLNHFYGEKIRSLIDLKYVELKDNDIY